MPQKTIAINGRRLIFEGHADQYLDHLAGGGKITSYVLVDSLLTMAPL